MSVAFAERLRIEAPRGQLAARLDGPDGVMRGTALILNPHPLMGGRMDHPLLEAIVGALVARDIACLRFDYAGTGESDGTPLDIGGSMAEFWQTGTAAEDPLMIEDAQAADRLLADLDRGPRILVGYSFGAFVAASIAGERAVRGVGLVCPTMGRHAVPDLPPGTPAAVVHGEGDFAGDDAVLTAWCERQVASGPLQCRQLPGGHFLRGVERDAAEMIAQGVLA